MNRRGFLQSCLALAAAPAIVRADSLMRVVPRETLIYGMPQDGELVRANFSFPWGRATAASVVTEDGRVYLVPREIKRVFGRNGAGTELSVMVGGFVGEWYVSGSGVAFYDPKHIVSYERVTIEESARALTACGAALAR